jgi:hypothetical protein
VCGEKPVFQFDNVKGANTFAVYECNTAEETIPSRWEIKSIWVNRLVDLVYGEVPEGFTEISPVFPLV